MIVSELISTKEELEAFIEKIAQADWVAIDTEFLREKTYYAKLCLIQIEADDRRACIDPLAIDDMSAFARLMKNQNVTKVLHAAHQDIEIILQLIGETPQPIFDTQVAASVLGIGDQIGYGRLVESMLGVSLSKTQSRTDWSKRPLKKEQIEYAIDDVRYLAELYPIMHHQLASQNRLEWLNKDFAKAIDKETYAIKAEERWKKVRGNHVLKRPQLAVLKELAAWREEQASMINRPRKWVISDDILLDLSRQLPTTVEGIKDIRGVGPNSQKHHETWLELIEKGKNVPQADWPELSRSKKANATQNALIDMLMLVIQIQANKHNITAAVITTRKKVTEMILDGNTKLTDDWRGSLVNEQLEGVIKGELFIGMKNNEVCLLPKSEIN